APTMAGADLLQLPMHAGGALVIDLHPVHADVALARVRVPGHYPRQGDKAPAVQRPALLNGRVQQSRTGVPPVPTLSRITGQAGRLSYFDNVRRLRPGLRARGWGLELMDNFLARAILHHLRLCVPEVQRRAEQNK